MIKSSGSCIFQLVTRTWGSCHRCFQLAHIFPRTICMIKRCLQQIQRNQTDCVLIMPVWKSRPWYPVILYLLVASHFSYQDKILDLLILPGTNKKHPLCLKKFQYGCMAHLQKIPEKGFSLKMSNILLMSSWRKKNYQSV